ncbi:MAG: tRNA epoxyqueuosine(34) reductase QueG [Planctomycetes bacterium]|nr:tRNA epoxyqueuosine(34) reductase QueG [Planctomycetota bacterium]
MNGFDIKPETPNTQHQPQNLEPRLKAEASKRGFSLSGVAPATEADGFARFQDWLARGYAGEMSYLEKHAEKRRHPSGALESVRSVVMLGLEYSGRGQSVSDGVSLGQIASYAQGSDYHWFVWDRLNSLADWLEAEVPGCQTKAVADTAPLLERDFARRAGLGWVGKNTMLINPRRGSFFFLAALLTDIELKPDSPFATSHCGTCTACLDACPTNAFPQPFVLDATKCISYLTIELRSPIPLELRPQIGSWLYGCDVCQDVCPWNRKPSPGPVAFPHDPEMEWLDPVTLLGLDADAFRLRFKQTSLWRNRRAGLLRNAAIVLGNTGDTRALPALEQALTDPEEVIREAANWAIERIRERNES